MTENSPLSHVLYQDIRLVMPLFLLSKLKKHPLTNGLHPISLGKSSPNSDFTIIQPKSDHHRLLYCQTGQGLLHYKNRTRTINRGDLVLISPRRAFEYQSKSSTKHELYWINFEGKLADDFAERLLMKMDDGIAHVGALNNIYNDFDGLLALGSRGYTATNVIHAVHVFQQALSFLALQLRITAFNHQSKIDIDAVETLMQSNLHQELSLDTLAHYSQMSKFHFAKKFKELTDTAPIQHFINMKIQRACLLLDTTDESIKLIASQLGYSDPYYFSRLFKKMVGMSPKQYRISGRN